MKLPAKVQKYLSGGFFIFFGITILYFWLTVYIGPNEYGIKEVRFGINRGLQEEVYSTGLNLVLPWEKMHKFPKDVLVYELNSFPSKASTYNDDIVSSKSAHIQTSDGFFVDVDVSIIFRISDPYKVITTIGPGDLFWNNGIVPKAIPILKQALGQLNTDEFYKSPIRIEKDREAAKLLNEDLKPKGLEIEYVLVRYFHYSQNVQEIFEDRKLKDQMVLTNKARTTAAEMAAEVQKIVAEGEALVKIKEREASAYEVTKLAELENYRRIKEAEADLLVKLADAKATDLMTSALEGQGSEQMVGLEMAEVLKGIDTFIISSDKTNPLNLVESMSQFGIE